MLSANKSWYIHNSFRSDQRAKQVVSNSSGLVDFLIGVVNSVLNLPNRQMNHYGKTVINPESCPSNFWGGLVIKITLGLVHASCSLPEWQAV